MRNLLFFVFFLSFLPGCSRELNFKSVSFGSNINHDGEITDDSLEYNFKNYKKKGSLQNFFDYIYFEGETLCFAFKFSKDLPASYIEVWFIDKKSGRKFAAERVEIADDVIWGFSLVGSVMEKIYKNKSYKSIKTIGLPLKTDLEVELIYENSEKKVKKNFPFSFTINF